MEKKKDERKGEGTLAEDQRERGYYYDDAYGYEPYKSEEGKDQEEEFHNRDTEGTESTEKKDSTDS